MLRTVRLDATDLRVFERAAEPGEWAIPGGFEFADADPAALAGKARQAFLCGWLGTTSFGRATFVEVAEITAEEYEAVVARLARLFVERYGAPDTAAAEPVARDEVAFAAGLADHKVHTLLAVEREVAEAGLVERFRVVVPARAKDHAKIWEIVDDDT